MKNLYILFSFGIISYTTQIGVLADPERCTLPVDKGNCLASIPNYWYNTQTGQCEKFMYGGCGGNDNRFMSIDDCVQSCSCQVRPDAGPCKAINERWYYNPTRGCCEKFMYGGCQGNSNNFQSYEECNKMCSGSFTISLKPAGLNWGSMKISSISGDRSMGGTFGKSFGGSRTVWLHSESAPSVGKGVLEAMASSKTMRLPGAKSSLQIIGREVTGPGLVQAEKTSKTWSSGPIQTGSMGTVQISSGVPVLTGGMTEISGQSGPFVSGGMTEISGQSGPFVSGGMTEISGQSGPFVSGGRTGMTGQSVPLMSQSGSSFSIGGKSMSSINPGGLTVSSQGGVVSDDLGGAGRFLGGNGFESIMRRGSGLPRAGNIAV